MDRFTVIHGLDLVLDPGLAQLRRYVPVLGVIAAPYAGLNGNHDPLNPLDPVSEWAILVDAIAAAADRRTPAGAPLALARLDPPTSGRLRDALQAIGPDSFRIVHIVCYGERDMLYLEDENGHEAYVVAEHFARLLASSQVELVVLDGCFSHRMAQLLIDQAGVQGVVGTRRKVAGRASGQFAAMLYAGLANGDSLHVAYRAALAAIADLPDSPADRYEIVAANDDARLTLPPPGERARRPLLADGQAQCVGVPRHEGFVGRRELLSRLAHDIPGVRVVEITGSTGIGKSWLAAEFARRFAWRFPDGVVWSKCHSQMTVGEVAGQIAHVLGLPACPSADDVAAELGRRRVLFVLDQIDAIVSRAELEQLGAWLRAMPPESESVCMLTARQASLMLSGLGRSYGLERLPAKAARTLAMRQAVERGVDELDVDTIDDFLERTLSIPWLIVKGVELAQADGVARALDEFDGIRQDMADPVAEYLARSIKLLSVGDPSTVWLLARLQSLPDAFDDGMARALGDVRAPQQIDALTRKGLLQSVGDRYCLTPAVRGLIGQLVPLKPDQQLEVDRAALLHLIHEWPGDEAALNNLRAIVRRQSGSDAGLHPALVAQALILAAPGYRAAGLADEFLAAAGPIREQLPEGRDLARLQVAMGETLGLLPGRQDEAGWLFQVTSRIAGLDPETLAQASRAYACHLIQGGQAGAAAEVLSRALRTVLGRRPTNVAQAAGLAHEWANALVAGGQIEQALARFKAALAGYAEARLADQSASVQCDYGAVLVAQGELDQAEDLLRRAMATADRLGLRDLAARARELLAQAHLAYAARARQAGDRERARREQSSALLQLSDALAERLPAADPSTLGRLYQDLGRTQAMLAQLDDAADNLTRSRNMLARAGDLAGEGRALLALGQLRLAQGDSVMAQAALHQAIDAAEALGDSDLLRQAAGVLVRVHQLRARHAGKADRLFRVNALDQATFSFARLHGLGLDELAAALDIVIRHLSRQ